MDKNLAVPAPQALKIAASELKHPILRPVKIDLRDGVSPDEAAVLTVLLNPTLRADRDRRGLATAQLIQAGVLPNPQLSYSFDRPFAGDTAGAINAFGFGLSWDVTSLITLLPKLEAARANVRSVDLDVSWVEWQMAQSARIAAYRVAALEEQLQAARSGDEDLKKNVETMRAAVDRHDKTLLDLSAAESTSKDARITVLSLEQELAKQRLALNRAMGLPYDAKVPVQNAILPAHITPASEKGLIGNLENRRLDLLALKQGYASEDANLRAAILAQFPKISLGINRAGDTSNVQTLGLGITVDIPSLDRNLGNIATERATRQKLFDEYSDRLFQARSDVATAAVDIRLLNQQVAESEGSIPALQRLADTAKFALDAGNSDVISYYQTRYDLILRRIDVLKLRQQLVEAHIALEIASGCYLPIAP